MSALGFALYNAASCVDLPLRKAASENAHAVMFRRVFEAIRRRRNCHVTTPHDRVRTNGIEKG